MYCLTLIPIDRPIAPALRTWYLRHCDAVSDYQYHNERAQVLNERSICQLHHKDTLILEVVLPLLEGSDQSFTESGAAGGSTTTALSVLDRAFSHARAQSPSGGSDSVLICRETLCARLFGREGMNP